VALNVRGEEAKASEPNKTAAEAPVILIDTATGKAVHGFSLARKELVAVPDNHMPFAMFTPDSRQLLAVDAGGKIRLWQAETCQASGNARPRGSSTRRERCRVSSDRAARVRWPLRRTG
jgi:hypothetical protein